MTYTPSIDHKNWVKVRRKNPLLCAGCGKPLGNGVRVNQRHGQASRAELIHRVTSEKSVLHVHFRDQDCLIKAVRKQEGIPNELETEEVAASA